jgi:hypothetical protein
MNLARRFNAGARSRRSVRVAWRRLKLTLNSIVAMRRETGNDAFPALKRRAKFVPALRAEDN